MKKILYKDKYVTIEGESIKLRGKNLFVSREIRSDVIVVVPELDSGKLLLERQYRHALKRYIYEFPAGMIEKGEKPADAVVRELEEETGYRAGKISLLANMYWAPGYTSQVYNFFLAEKLKKGGKKHFGDTENIETFTATPKQVAEMIRKKKIVDGKSIMTFYLYKSAKGW